MRHQSIGSAVVRRSMPILVLITSAILSNPAAAGGSCVFNDSGMVNVPGEIRVPATMPIGSVIATGQADINISCQVDDPTTAVVLYFSRLRRCGDSKTWIQSSNNVWWGTGMSDGSTACNTEDINVGISKGEFSEVYQTQYPGVGIRMKMTVKSIQNLAMHKNSDRLHFQPGATGSGWDSPCPTYTSMNNSSNFYHACQDPVNRIAASNRDTRPVIQATQYSFQGQMLVELVKIRSLVWPGNPFIESGWRGPSVTPLPSPSNQIASPYQSFLDHVFQVGLSGVRGPQSPTAIRVHGAFAKEAVGVDINGQGQLYGTKAYRLATRVIDTAACDIVGSKNISVNMGQTSTTTLDNNATPEVPFQITLNCPAGARARLTFTDSSNPSNQTDKLGLSAGSEASGLALQLRSNSKIINFAPDTTISANAVRVDESGIGGVVTVPLTAQVVKTGTVKPGKYTAQSTVTVSYQ